MSLSARIMNIQHGPEARRENWLDYADGHLHARHAAAELAAEADAIRDELVAALEECLDDSIAAVDQYVLNYGENWRPQRLAAMRAQVERARAALARAKGQQA